MLLRLLLLPFARTRERCVQAAACSACQPSSHVGRQGKWNILCGEPRTALHLGLRLALAGAWPEAWTEAWPRAWPRAWAMVLWPRVGGAIRCTAGASSEARGARRAVDVAARQRDPCLEPIKRSQGQRARVAEGTRSHDKLRRLPSHRHPERLAADTKGGGVIGRGAGEQADRQMVVGRHAVHEGAQRQSQWTRVRWTDLDAVRGARGRSGGSWRVRSRVRSRVRRVVDDSRRGMGHTPLGCVW